MKQADISRLGKYDILGELGRGAMGIVYQGRDPVIERFVALKTVRREGNGADDAEGIASLARFKREAQAAGRLGHPHIVAIHDYGEEGPRAYIAMEFIEGRDLKDYFDHNERFETETILRIMDEVLSALDYAHDHGVVHRDIKPANILITRAGTVKITDFGIAHLESSNLTQAGEVMGTPSYMSPEQILGQPVDARSDLFSAGGVLYQLLTGEKPFTGEHYAALLHRVLHEEPDSPSLRAPDRPPAFDRVVAVAMAKRVEDRYQSAAAFARALREITPSIGATTREGGGDAGEKGRRETPNERDRAFDATVHESDGAQTAAAPKGAEIKIWGRIGLIRGLALGVVLMGGVGGVVWLGAAPQERVPTAGSVPVTSGAARVEDPIQKVEDPIQKIEDPIQKVEDPAQKIEAPPQTGSMPRRSQEAEQARNAADEAERIEAARRRIEAQRRQERRAAAQAVLEPVRSALNRAPCAILTADVDADGALVVTGALGEAGLGESNPLARLPVLIESAFAEAKPLGNAEAKPLGNAEAKPLGNAEAKPLGNAEAKPLGNEVPYVVKVDMVSRILCDPLMAINRWREANREMSRPVAIVPVNPEGVYKNGQMLILDIHGPGFPAYLQVDYFTLEGYVVHLLPNAQEKDHALVAGGQRRLGDPAGGGRFWTVGQPFGRELIVAVASAKPLFAGPRPEAEPVLGYLTELRKALDLANRGETPPVATALFITSVAN